MRKSLIEKTYEWNLTAAPTALWPMISDTARLNEALGMPRYRIDETFDRGSIRRRYGSTVGESKITRWEEPLFEWVENGWWRWHRFYDEGPLREAGGVLMLMPGESGGTHARYVLSAEPNGTLGRMLVGSGHLKLAARSLEKLTHQMDAHCRKPIGDFYSNLSAASTKKKSPKLPKAKDTEAAVLTQFAEWLAVAPLADRIDLRSKRLARCLGVSEAEALKACLIAVKSGDLVMRYRAVCPTCRASAVEFRNLAKIQPLLACQRCGAGYRRDLAGTVEVVFSVQGLDESRGGFCGSGPSAAQHMVVQQNLGAMERRDLDYVLPVGTYLVRAIDGPVSSVFDVDTPSRFRVRLTDNTVEVEESADDFYIENHCKREFTVAIEKCEWPSDALPASDLFAEQAFHDLMPDQVLPDGDSASVGFGIVLGIGDLAQPLSNDRGGAVVEEDDGYKGIVFTSISGALASAEKLAKVHPDARFALDCGDLTISTSRNRLCYSGGVPETAKTKCLAGHRGSIFTSPRMKEVLAAVSLPVPKP